MMSTRNFIYGALFAAALASFGASAQAATYNVNLAGWQANGDYFDPLNPTAAYADPGNSGLYVTLAGGSHVTGFSYTNLVFTTNGLSADPASSQQSDLVLSVNSTDVGFGAGPEKTTVWLDWKPVSDFAAYGTTAHISGAWGVSPGLAGPYTKGGSFVTLAGVPLFITTYLSYSPANGISISSGTLSINYTPAAVPEPSTYVLMGLGLLGMAAITRRRRFE